MKIIFFTLLLLLLPDLYIWWLYIRKKSLFWKTTYWLPLIATIIIPISGILGYIQPWTMRLFFTLLLCVALPKILFAIISLIDKLINIFFPHKNSMALFTGTVIAILTIACSYYGFSRGWRKVQIKEQTISSSSIPKSFDSYRIVQISDLHISTFDNAPKTVDEIIKKINSLNADIVLFTGDLINTTPKELVPYMKPLSSIESRDGIYSILGNHDYCGYHKWDSKEEHIANFHELQSRQKELQWDLLLNEHRIIRKGNDSIALIGVEHHGKLPYGSRVELEKAVKDLSHDTYKVLMLHDPAQWRNKVLNQHDIDLTLSGHTHAMQFRIGSFSPSMWLFKEWGGYYNDGNQHLYVNLGTGSNIPFRLGAWPEITLITLKHTP